MAYNPNLYSPYAAQQLQPMYQMAAAMQPINGLTFIDNIGQLDTLQMAPGSVSQPYFLKDEDKFVVVTFDKMGGSTKELFSFKKEPMETGNNSGEFVTREYFDQQMNNILEAINGQHPVQPAAEQSE